MIRFSTWKIKLPIIAVVAVLFYGCEACALQAQPSGQFIKDQSSKQSLEVPVESPRVLVYKTDRKLELYSNEKLLRTYRVGLGFSPVPDKIHEGDGATPEGEFYVFVKNGKSAYYLSLGLSYPN